MKIIKSIVLCTLLFFSITSDATEKSEIFWCSVIGISLIVFVIKIKSLFSKNNEQVKDNEQITDNGQITDKVIFYEKDITDKSTNIKQVCYTAILDHNKECIKAIVDHWGIKYFFPRWKYDDYAYACYEDDMTWILPSGQIYHGISDVMKQFIMEFPML